MYLQVLWHTPDQVVRPEPRSVYRLTQPYLYAQMQIDERLATFLASTDAEYTRLVMSNSRVESLCYPVHEPDEAPSFTNSLDRLPGGRARWADPDRSCTVGVSLEYNTESKSGPKLGNVKVHACGAGWYWTAVDPRGRYLETGVLAQSYVRKFLTRGYNDDAIAATGLVTAHHECG